MFLLISIFSFSVVACGAMVGFRIWEMDKGKVPVPFFNRVDFAESFHVFAEWERKIWEEGKHWSMRLSAQLLRGVVILIDKARIEMRKLISRMETSMVRKHPKDSQGAPSFFLKEISEHKRKMQEKWNENHGGASEVDKL